MVRSWIAVILILFFWVSSAPAQSLLYLPLDHWAYPILDRFSALNLIPLDLEVRPVPRGEIVGAMKPLLEKIERGEVYLSSTDLWYLNKLKVEFKRELQIEPEKNADRPLLEFEEEEGYFTMDTRLGGLLLFQEKSHPTRVFPLDLSTFGELGKRLGYDENISVSFRKGNGVQELGFSNAGLRSWRDVWASIERAYFIIDLSPLQLEAGRNRKWWGPGRFGTLLLSANAPPLDLIHLSTQVWRIRASGFTALLSPDEGRFFSSHRLSIHLGERTVIGVSEAVLYTRRNVELGYLNPLIPYYATQRNVYKDDNIFWNFDFSTFPLKWIKVYGEFLIDDFQYSNRDSFPDKLGGIVGLQWMNPIGIQDTDLLGEWGRINRWVYTHRKSINAYLHDGAFLGDGLGPDGERIHLLITHRWTNRISTTLEGISIRIGEGRDGIAWEVNRPDPHPSFPSGIVESRRSVGMGLDYESFWWLRFNLSSRWVNMKNEGNIGGEDSEGFQVKTGVEIDF